MRFIHAYLIGYFILIAGAGLALWQAGVLGHISAVWLLISGMTAIGLGVLVAVTSGRPDTVPHE